MAPGLRIRHVAFVSGDISPVGLLLHLCPGPWGPLVWYRLIAIGEKRTFSARPKGNVVDVICAGCNIHQRVLRGASRPIRLPATAAYLDICDMFPQAKIRNPSRKNWRARDWIVDSGPLHIRSSQPARRRFSSSLALRAVGARWNGTLYNA